MSYQLIVKNRATQDIRQQANYILVNGNARTAERFLQLAEATFAQLATIPGMGKIVRLVYSRMGEIRQWRIKDFQDYLIFYQIQDDRVEILRVLHGARDLEDILSNIDEEV
ncbi:type II toxin-antitoxin system RelE/ParE family toxin [Lyngbya sp. CCAP 1446/10]|uniref:type II toxin-antitoxin system RelE/ParE family toxin n=1 Tax=Lyngbya sp. CCAP 1446/10 TaxID=439293 RepID=UPI0022372BB6|nr:type II toxin-antitoxin system RelE/ParE family toxin [Lyngbya sp. CCAP 1446/10]MCW6048816.1 type II toxin-antitoxin system RelE/ParE family toxin [Lyngbya sp. CCAP 1446/10]